MSGNGIRDPKLLDAVRQKAWNTHNGIYRPRVAGDHRSNWPTCGLCGRDVEAVELKNQNSFGVEIWARCHGKEDWYTVKYPFRIEGDDEKVQDQIRIAMRAFTPFRQSITL